MMGASTTEECHSSESGWTMYIGSPIEEENDHEEEEDFEGNYQGDPGFESDDSMASDASSGPSHYGIHACGLQKEEEEYDEDHDEYCLVNHHRHHEKASENKQVAEKRGEKKEMIFLNSNGEAQEE
ncbi:protein SOB FIVE-LIKE 4-like [Lotus japonicus]|uniref:protein SOB FIVE-LIKE 4-like n=1 Tax=Lotus japonicus TaxID=34305 RepID=UPI00258B28B2|nr:protein SOB FIVE-LIKE 4-like [Lotus japonicus]